MFFTVPRSTLPSDSVSSVVFFFSAFSSSSSALRESTMLPRFLLTLMTRMRSSWPRRASRLRTGRTSICEPGRNARTPMSTARPPLMRSMTRPMTTLRSAYAFSTSSQIFIFSAFSRDSTMWPLRSSVRSSRTSMMSPACTVTSPSFVEELADGDQAFGLVADVHDHGGFGEPEHGALDHLAFRHVAEAVVVERDERRASAASSTSSRCMGLKVGPAGLPERVRPGAGCVPSTSGDTIPFSAFAIPCMSSFVPIAGFCCGHRLPAL